MNNHVLIKQKQRIIRKIYCLHHLSLQNVIQQKKIIFFSTTTCVETI